MQAPPPNAPDIHVDPLSYETRLDARDAGAIDLVVIHCTELPDLATARDYGERVQDAGRGTGFSGHYYVDRDGRVAQWVDPLRVAHHVRGHNPRSIGIELVNLGRHPHWFDSRHQQMTEPYPDAQLEGLVALLRHLAARFPNLRTIAGHEDLDTGEVPATDDPSVLVRRKRDPGVMFPWERVLSGVPALSRGG